MKPTQNGYYWLKMAGCKDVIVLVHGWDLGRDFVSVSFPGQDEDSYIEDITGEWSGPLVSPREGEGTDYESLYEAVAAPPEAVLKAVPPGESLVHVSLTFQESPGAPVVKNGVKSVFLKPVTVQGKKWRAGYMAETNTIYCYGAGH